MTARGRSPHLSFYVAMTTLDRLVSVRSQLAEGLRAYLTAYVLMRIGPRPLWADRGATPDALYVEPHVVGWNPEQRPASAEEELRGAFGRHEERERRQWADVWPSVTHAVIVGRPGEGKTVLTQRACRDVAAVSLRALNERTQAVSELAVPIWLRVTDLVRYGSVEAALKSTALVKHAIEAGTAQGSATPAATRVTEYLVAALDKKSTCLFLDAFDERDKRRDLAGPLGSALRLPCRVVVTGRPYAYERGLLGLSADEAVEEYELAPLSPDQRRSFIVDRWFAGDAERGAQVADLVEQHPRFSDLAANPLLLTLICLAATDRRRRFDATTRRIHLYRWTVRDMVRGAHKAPAPDDDVEVDERLLVLARAAWSLFAQQPGDTPFAFVAWKRALQAACVAEQIAFRESLTTELQEVGLLVSPSTGELMLLHRSFFEFLAATGLAQEHPSVIVNEIAAHVSEASWREVVLLTVCALGLSTGGAAVAGRVVDALLARPPAPGAPGEIVARMGQAVAEAPETGVPAASRKGAVDALLVTMRDDLRRAGRRADVPAKIRAEAGEALGKLGDPRFHGQNAWCLPNDRACGLKWDLFGFVEIPEGPFWMGSDKSRDQGAFDEETPQHEVTLGRYWIARWPVTVAQFRMFVEDRDNGGFHPGGLAGVANHPVVWVSWDEARRYCEWLTIKLRNSRGTPAPLAAYVRAGWVVTLPSEAEWEKAARGGDRRIYPWGPSFDRDRANCWGDEATAVKSTSAVGCFPGGASPYAVEELAGNVDEWTRSAERRYPYNADDGREGMGGNDPWVVRGGSFGGGVRLVRAAYRDGVYPDGRGGIGFRVVVSPFRS